MISTLDNYVQGLGATLRIAAVFECEEGETVIPIQIGSKTR